MRDFGSLDLGSIPSGSDSFLLFYFYFYFIICGWLRGVGSNCPRPLPPWRLDKYSFALGCHFGRNCVAMDWVKWMVGSSGEPPASSSGGGPVQRLKAAYKLYTETKGEEVLFAAALSIFRPFYFVFLPTPPFHKPSPLSF